MKRSAATTLVATAILAVIVCGGTVTPSSGNNAGSGRHYVPGQLVIQLHAGADAQEIKDALKEADGTLIDTASEGNLTFALIEVAQPEKNFTKSWLKLAKDRKHFDFVQPNNIYTYTATTATTTGWPNSGYAPNNPNYLQQAQVLSHQAIAAQQILYAHGKAMPISKGAVKIGIIDTGVQGNIKEFAPGQVAAGFNAVTGGAGNTDPQGHGTFNACLMAAQTNNALNGAGMLPGATIVPVNVFNGTSGASTFSIIRAIQYLQRIRGLKYINASLNSTAPNTLNTDTAYMSAAAGFNKACGGTIFNAAGNDSSTDNSKQYPYNTVIEAVDANMHLPVWTNTGTAVVFAGIGVNDGSTNNKGNFTVGDGTSYATPSCCAIAAAIQYVSPNMSLAQTIALMKANSVNTDNNVPLPDMSKCIKALF